MAVFQILIKIPFAYENKKNSKIHWEKIEKRFSIFEFRLEINFSLFRLGHFGKVESQLGSPVAGVEIDTG